MSNQVNINKPNHEDTLPQNDDIRLQNADISERIDDSLNVLESNDVEGVLDEGYQKIGDAINSRVNELTVDGMSESDASAQAIDEFWGSKPAKLSDVLDTTQKHNTDKSSESKEGTKSDKSTDSSREGIGGSVANDSNEDGSRFRVRPVKEGELAEEYAENPANFDMSDEDVLPIGTMGNEPWALEVDNPPERVEPNQQATENSVSNPADTDGVPFFIDDSKDKTEDAEQLTTSEDGTGVPFFIDNGRREDVIGGDSPEKSALRPTEHRDVQKALDENPGVLDPEDDESVGPAAIASIAEEPWNINDEHEPPTPPPGPPTPPGPPGPPTPPSPPPDDGPLRIGIANLDKSLDALAKDAAEAIKDRETTQRGFRGFIKKIWHGGSFQKLPFQRNRVEARRRIVESGNIHINAGGNDADMTATANSVIEKITHDNVDEFIASGSGETHRRITAEDDPKAVALKNTIHSLISRYADGTLDDANFEEAKNEALRELAVNDPEFMGEGDLFADNLLEIAQNVKSRVRHDLGVEAILADAVIDIGQIRVDAKTEAQYSRIESVMDRLENTRLGGLVNETTLVTAVSAIASIGAFTKNIATSKALKIVGIGFVASAVLAGFRQAKVVKDERRHHIRDIASGLDMTDGMKRRQRLEQSRYDTVEANDVSAYLDGLFVPDDGSGLRRLNDLTPEQFMEAVGMVSQIRTRDRLSDEQSIDLFSYSSPEAIGDERLQMQASALYADALLSEYLEAHGGVAWLEGAGLVGAGIGSYENLRVLANQGVEAEVRVDIDQKDRAFSNIRRSEALKAALIGGIVGVGVGFAFQEGMAHMPGIGNSLYGLGEGPVQPGGRGTTLTGLFGPKAPGNTGNLVDLGGHSRLAEHVGITPKQDSSGKWFLEQAGNGKRIELDYDKTGMLTSATKDRLSEAGFGVTDKLSTPNLSGKTVTETLGYNKVTLPEEFKLHQLAPGKFEILNPDGSKAHNVSLNFDGSFDDQTIASLRAAGINPSVSTNTIIETTTVTKGSPLDIIKDHLGETKHVHRQLWAANNTPAPRFDLNELRADAAGTNGSWFNEHGDVVIDISRMKPDGSFQGAYHVNPLDLAAQGKLSLGVSVSQDTQGTPFNFPIKTMPDGRVIAVIPKSSVVNQLFEMKGGKRVFNGRVFEVLHNTGQVNPNGSENVVPLASLPGDNNPGTLTYDIKTPRTIYDTSLGLKPPKVPLEVIAYDAKPLVDAPPAIPFYARRGLEPLRRRRTPEYHYGTYGARSPEEIDEFLEDVSPVLIDNPRARIDIADGVNWYDSLLRRRRGDDYANRINDTVLNSPELSALDDSTDAIVAIPVRASTEAENIYSTLSLYGQQPDSTQNSSTILLHLNWVDSELADPSKVAEIQRTRDEIERAKRDFPGLKIAIMETEFKPDDIKNGAIGVVVRKMYDTVILSTKKAIDEGRMSPDHEVVLIRNDSDAKGMSPSYIERMVSTVKDGDTDAASGRIRWGIEQVKDLPGLSVVTQFYEGVRGSVERASKKGISTSGVTTVGINTGVRVSTLAAVGSIGFEDYTDAGSDDLPVAGRINNIRMDTSPVRQSLYAKKNKRHLRGWLSRRRRLQKYEDRNIEGQEGDSTVVIAAGSMIDSDALRLEESYRKGKPVHLAWGDWGSGAEKHKERGSGIPAGAKGETLKTKDDMDKIAKRIEFQISEIVNGWRIDSRHAEMELRRMFPLQHGSSEPIYSFSKSGGTYKLEFTEYGKEVLRDRLTRNNSGQWDPVGSRRTRVNYGDPTASRSFPSGKTPRLVKALK